MSTVISDRVGRVTTVCVRASADPFFQLVTNSRVRARAHLSPTLRGHFFFPRYTGHTVDTGCPMKVALLAFDRGSIAGFRTGRSFVLPSQSEENFNEYVITSFRQGEKKRKEIKCRD